MPLPAFAHLLKSRQCRCNANHCCAAQSHRTANRTSALPLLDLSLASGALPPRIRDVNAIPSPRCSSPFLCLAYLCFSVPLLRHASPCYAAIFRCYAPLGLALPLPIYAPHGLAKPLPFISLRCRCASSQIMAMPLQCKSLLRCAEPSHGKSNSALPWQRRDQRCDSLALRLSPHRRCK